MLTQVACMYVHAYRLDDFMALRGMILHVKVEDVTYDGQREEQSGRA